MYATKKAVLSTRVSVEPTQQIFDFLSPSASYLTETINQNSSTIWGFRMWNRFFEIPSASSLNQCLYFSYMKTLHIKTCNVIMFTVRLSSFWCWLHMKLCKWLVFSFILIPPPPPPPLLAEVKAEQPLVQNFSTTAFHVDPGNMHFHATNRNPYFTKSWKLNVWLRKKC